MPRAQTAVSKSLVDGLRVTSIIGVAGIYTNSQYRLLQALAGLHQVLSPDEISKLSQTPAPSGTSAIDEICRDIIKENEKRRFLRLSSKFESFFQSLFRFWPVIDVLVSSKPEVASLIWGSCKFVVIAALNYYDYFEQISKVFDKLGDFCSYFDRFLKILPDSSRLHSALADYFAASVRFNTSAIQFLKRSTAGQIFKSIWSPYKLSFQDLEEELNRQQGLVNNEIELAREEAALRARQEMSLFRRDGRNNQLLMIQNHAETKSMHSNVMTTLNGIENSYSLQNSQQKITKRKSLLDGISTYEHRLSLSRAYGKRHKNTGLWFFETPEYKEWDEDPKSSGLWCYGIPGAGKTILMAGVIEHLFLNQQKTSKTSISYIFCEFSDEESMKASTILRSLIKQILSVFEKIPSEMEQNFENKLLNGHRDPEIEDLSRMLLDIAGVPRTSYIIIDGLDECKLDARKKVLDCVNQLVRNSKNRIKIIISSRDKVDISRYLKDFTKISLYSAKNHSDIEVYIRETIEEKLKSELTVGPGMSEEIIDALMKGSDGMFLWVEFQILEICRENNDDDIRMVLKSLPKNLDETYLRILRRIVDNHKPDIAIKVFRWLAVARRHLLLEELNEAVAFDPGCLDWGQGRHQNDAFNMLRNCGNFIVHDRSDGTIQFAHHTVLEFLESERVPQSAGDFFIDKNRANLYVGLICLRYLSFPELETAVSRVSKRIELPAPTGWAGSTAVHHPYMEPLSSIHPKNLFVSRNAIVSSIPILHQTKRKKHPSDVLSAKFYLLEYISQNWIYHCGELSDEDRGSFVLFDKVLFYHKLSFNHLPWAQQDYSQSNSYYKEASLWAIKADNPAVFRAAFYKLQSDSDASYCAEVVQEALFLACMCGKEVIISHLFELGAKHDILGKKNLTALQLAAGQGNLATVYQLMKCRADINEPSAPTEDGMTALEAAAGGGHLSVVDLLLRNNAKVNSMSTGSGRTALLTAAENGHPDVVKVLLEGGANVNEAGFGGRTPLEAAAANGHPNVVKVLLKRGAKVDDASSRSGRTALVAAAANGRPDVVKVLLERGAKVGDFDGRAALVAAAENGYLDVVKVLLENDSNADLWYRRAALVEAAANGHLDVVKVLLENGANASAGESGRTPLQAAAANGHPDVVKVLLEGGANVNTAGFGGRTPLEAAAANGHPDAVKVLLEGGANVNTADLTERTPLEAAAANGHPDVVKVLLEGGANVNEAGFGGRTPLEAAAENGHPNVVKVLLKRGAKVDDASSRSGRTALVAAAANGRPDVVKVLLEGGANVNTAGFGGRTPPEAAAANGHPDVVKVLLERGAKVGDFDGRAALVAAAENGHLDIVKVLLKNGAKADMWYGRAALEAAAASGHLDVVKVLLGTKPNTESIKAALEAAAASGHHEVVELLKNFSKK